MMLSKAKIKFIKSLQLKKYRKQEQCFVVQGAKSVHELLASDFEVQLVLGTADFLDKTPIPNSVEVIPVSENDLAGVSEFQTNDSALAVAKMKDNTAFKVRPDEFALVLDDIRDPGNLGTMIRTADWYGISKIIASEETADFYNAKVISATMGSFVRVTVHYTSLLEYLATTTLPIYGAYLDGKDVHTVDFGKGGLIVIGNESRGISDALENKVTQKITIPQYGKAESLNAAIAMAIICDNIRRGKGR